MEPDRNGDGSIDFDEFLINLRPPMNAHRQELVSMAFNKIDKTGDGGMLGLFFISVWINVLMLSKIGWWLFTNLVLTVADVAKIYSADAHPKYRSGELTSMLNGGLCTHPDSIVLIISACCLKAGIVLCKTFQLRCSSFRSWLVFIPFRGTSVWRVPEVFRHSQCRWWCCKRGFGPPPPRRLYIHIFLILVILQYLLRVAPYRIMSSTSKVNVYYPSFLICSKVRQIWNQSIDPYQVTKEEFLNYYSAVSSSIDNGWFGNLHCYTVTRISLGRFALWLSRKIGQDLSRAL
mgnify:CR=1 FL=1